MKHRAFLFVCVGFLCLIFASGCYASESLEDGLQRLADEIVRSMTEDGKHKVAVLEFSNLDGRATEFGQLVGEELITRLFATQRFSVVEREMLGKIIEEHRLNMSGAINEKTAKRFGRLSGVDVICSGTVADLGDVVRLNARLISTETGSIFAAASVEITGDDRMKKLLAKVKRPVMTNDRSKNQSGRKKVKKNSELVYNGSFTRRFEGWERGIGDVTQGSSKVETVTFPHSNSNSALHIKHRGNGHVQFAQVVDVPHSDLTFSASFQASSHEGPIMGFSGTGLVQIALQFLDEDDGILGRTVLINYVKNPFADTALIGVPRRKDDTYKTHYIEFGNGRFYKDYRLDLRKEIENNLLGTDIEALRKVAVIIWCGASGSQAGSELWITDVSVKTK